MQMDGTSMIAVLIPLVSIVMGIGIAFWAIYWGHRTKQLKYKERELMIEKGLTPPPMEPDKPCCTPEDYLRRGILMIFLGIGLGIGYWVLLHAWGPPAWLCGVAAGIVELLGIGNLLYYVIVRNKGTDRPANGGNVTIP